MYTQLLAGAVAGRLARATHRTSAGTKTYRDLARTRAAHRRGAARARDDAQEALGSEARHLLLCVTYRYSRISQSCIASWWCHRLRSHGSDRKLDGEASFCLGSISVLRALLRCRHRQIRDCCCAWVWLPRRGQQRRILAHRCAWVWGACYLTRGLDRSEDGLCRAGSVPAAPLFQVAPTRGKV